MGYIFYRLIITFYDWSVWVAALFNEKARKFVKGRIGLLGRIEKALAGNNVPIAWFHCASLGEFEQARPVMEKFREAFPQYKIFLTFFSPSGYEVRKNYEKADYIFYLPIDNTGNAKKLISLVNPQIAFFVKYEFWHHYLKALHKNQVPVISFSTIFRSDQLFFKPYGKFYRNLLNYFHHIFVQNKVSFQLLASINFNKVSISGDTRFDRVQQICSKPVSIPLAPIFKGKSRLMVMGSTWPSDMEVLLPMINDPVMDLKYIIAPHNIKEDEIISLEKQLEVKSIRFSQASEANVQDQKVLIIDNIGMLSSLYQYGELAYIGGAFRQALHNTLEAATFGMPIFFGRNETNRKFKEAIELEEEGAAFPIRTTDELKQKVLDLLNNEEKRSDASTKAAEYIRKNTGATEKILALTTQILN
ncbi:MAG: 3-deoxy-D-manno-octulosonic acid transferase [Candidatus Cyclobacteriaceae bacterium M3_2C_046]